MRARKSQGLQVDERRWAWRAGGGEWWVDEKKRAWCAGECGWMREASWVVGAGTVFAGVMGGGCTV